MLCGDASKEFAVESHNMCPIINNHLCPCDELEQLEGQIRDFLYLALKKRQELRSRVNHFHNQEFHQIQTKSRPRSSLTSFFFYVSSVQLERPVDRPCWYPSSTHILLGPLILGAVCRKWREIAWPTPPTLEFYNNTFPKSLSSNLTIAREWLGRSGQLPLSISIIMWSHYRYNIADHLLPMVHLLNKYAGRWHHLEFYAIPHDLLSSFKINLNDPALQGASALQSTSIVILARNGMSPHRSSKGFRRQLSSSLT